MWNYFRLENEHLYNVGKFRAVRDIFVEPIRYDDDLRTMIHLMDNEHENNGNNNNKNNEDDDNDNDNGLAEFL